MKKYVPDSVMLTKLAFEQYAQRLKETTASQYGMTVEEWDDAILKGSVVQLPKTDVIIDSKGENNA